MESKKNNLLIAGSIIVAGALIAVGIYLAPSATQQENNTAQQGDSEPQAINVEPVSENDYIRGNQGAAVTLIEYSDLECPFCQEFHKVMKQVLEQYEADQVAWVFRHFPIEQLHSKAPIEAHAAECAAEIGGEDSFWAFVDRVFEVSPANNGLDLERLPDIAEDVGLDRTAFVQCQEGGQHADTINEAVAEAQAAGASGTPYNILVLNNELNDEQAGQLRQMFANARPGQFVIGESRDKIAISGMIPIQGMQQILDVLLE